MEGALLCGNALHILIRVFPGETFQLLAVVETGRVLNELEKPGVGRQCSLTLIMMS